MKLYKFRSLANKKEFNEVKKIIKTGKFYFSDWDKMNDPMEGYFSCLETEEWEIIANKIAQEKNKYKICSFADSWKNILMWSHYADNHKGICIEVKVPEDKDKIKEIIYVETITEIQELIGNDDIAKEILRRKIDLWEYEKEIRVFKKSKELHEVGEITAVYFGLKCEKYKQELEELCKETKMKNGKSILTSSVEININNNKMKKR